MNCIFQFEKDLLSNLKLNVISASYTECIKNLKNIDFVSNYNTFYFICSGDGWIKISKRDFYSKSGQLILVPSKESQLCSTIGKENFKYFSCSFTAEIGDINLFDVMSLPYFVDISNLENLKSTFVSLVLEADKTTLSSIIKEKALLAEIIFCYIQSSNIDFIKSSKFPWISDIISSIKYIETNISENVTIERLANEFNFNPVYFTKVFKKFVGISPIQYINKMKLEKAKELLKETRLKVNQISELTGFYDVYYFSKVFKSYYGLSPKDYRNI